MYAYGDLTRACYNKWALYYGHIDWQKCIWVLELEVNRQVVKSKWAN